MVAAAGVARVAAQPVTETAAAAAGPGYIGPMKRLLAALVVLALPAWASAPTGCARLCGQWLLDAAQSAAVEPAVDAALKSYEDPRPRRGPRIHSDGTVSGDTRDQLEADMERSIGPIHNRPFRDELRDELLAVLATPSRLNLDARGGEILIAGENQPARRLSPGTPKARVNAQGLAKINATLKADRLTITEQYDRKRRYTETYLLQDGGTLLVTREVQRPGMKALRIQSVYRRS